ncbi:hypothetical protein [Trinickia acidisoli]|uniref:hypothetical protein n=1 Tax=Trinickia acidisoli TaxID=2767482 RepID=UPI001A8D3C01|nr:hypothetical protein [Trinickia acidisoli]
MSFRIDGAGGPVGNTTNTPSTQPPKPTQPTPTSAPASVPHPGFQLKPGEKLTAGQSIRSADGRFELTMQHDGNLVEYDLATKVAVWSSNTAKSGATVAYMQQDGNLVLDKVAPDTLCVAGKNDVWSTQTNGHAGAALTLQTNGDLTVGNASGTANGAFWQSGEPLYEVPGSLPPLATPTPPVTDDQLSSAAVGLFKPGAGELGISRFNLSAGGNAYDVLRDQHVFDQPGLTDDTPLLDANLAATPSLDRQPFGERAANPPTDVYDLPVGKTVVVLDSTRLADLEQQRTQLKAAEQGPKKDQAAALSKLTASAYQELLYAATQQAVPNIKQLASTLRSRAPGDQTYQGAIDDASCMLDKTLKSQGRTADQLGKIDADAAAGNWNGVRQLVSSQIVAVAGNDQGAQALGDITARGSVYLTYAGGDPHFAAAVQNGINDAQHTLLVDRPAQAVVNAYKQHGAAAAMQTLASVTNPQTATIGQVGSIMSDSRVQSVIQQSLRDTASWQGQGSNRPTSVLMSLSSACQSAIESDQGTNGTGKAAVDRIATYIVAQADGVPPPTGMDVFQNVQLTQQVFADAGQQGNVALALAVGAQARLYRNDFYASAAIDGARQGLDGFVSTVASLKNKLAQDGSFAAEPLANWGGVGTPSQQAALVTQLFNANPKKAEQFEADSAGIPTLQETADSVQAAVTAYSSELKGVQGFDTAVPTSMQSGQYRWSVSNSPSVVAALHCADNLGIISADAKQDPTNTLWLQRSMRKVYDQIGKQLIGSLAADGTDSVFTPARVKMALTVWKDANKTFGADLYFRNAAYTLGEASSGGLFSALQNGASGIRQELGGVSYALSAAIPSGKLSSLRPGSGETPLAKSYASLADSIDGLDISAGARSTLKVSMKLAMQDTSDLASAILGISEAVDDFSNGKTIQGVGQLLNAAGYGTLLTGSGIDAAELPEGTTVLGLSGDAWDLIGGPTVAVAALLVTSADAYESSHTHDGDDKQALISMGVRPDVAAQLAKHATSFGGSPPSAGPFITQYFEYGHATQQQMVDWLNALTPHQADTIATALKAEDGLWQKEPMSTAAQQFDNALLQFGIMPPVSY